MTIHEAISDSNNDSSVSQGNRPNAPQRASALHCARTGETLLNHPGSGYMTEDQAMARHMDAPRDLSTKIWIVDLVTNDMRLRPSTPAALQWFEDFMCSVAMGAILTNKLNARTGAVATVGAWSNTGGDQRGMSTLALNASKTFIVNGTVVVCWLADNISASKGMFEIRIDGVLVDTVKVEKTVDLAPNASGSTTRYGPATRMYDVGPGPHAVEVKNITSGTYAFLSYVAGLEDQPGFPKLYIGNGSRVGGSAPIPVATSDLFRDRVEAIVSKLRGFGLPVKVVDTYSALSLATDYGSDGIHWNVAGQIVAEQCMCDAEREPCTLTYSTAWSTTLTVDLDAMGIVTAYAEA